jgi:hypothetical protein
MAPALAERASQRAEASMYTCTPKDVRKPSLQGQPPPQATCHQCHGRPAPAQAHTTDVQMLSATTHMLLPCLLPTAMCQRIAADRHLQHSIRQTVSTRTSRCCRVCCRPQARLESQLQASQAGAMHTHQAGSGRHLILVRQCGCTPLTAHALRSHA